MSEPNDNTNPTATHTLHDTPNNHLNIKVTDNNNEVLFKIKRTTPLKKLMDAFCERQGKNPSSVRFLFDGSRIQPTDNPNTVSITFKPHCTTVATPTPQHTSQNKH
jgi:small ubiquitin-related modifier